MKVILCYSLTILACMFMSYLFWVTQVNTFDLSLWQAKDIAGVFFGGIFSGILFCIPVSMFLFDM